MLSINGALESTKYRVVKERTSQTSGSSVSQWSSAKITYSLDLCGSYGSRYVAVLQPNKKKPYFLMYHVVSGL